MVDVCRPDVHHQVQATSGFFTSRNSATTPRTCQQLLTPTHLPILSLPFGSPNLYRGAVTSSVSMPVSQGISTLPFNPNPTPRVDANYSHLQGMQPTPLLPYQLGNKRQQLFHHQAPLGQHSQQQLYPSHQQDHLLYEDAYRAQPAPALAAPLKHVPSLDSYKQALQRHPINVFKPSKFQHQQNAVKDHYIGAQIASVSTSQLQTSFQPHPHDQKQSASVLVQRQPSLQNSTQKIPENNYAERKQIGVKLCQTAPLHREAVHCCSSARAPIRGQPVSPERKRLPDGNNTSSKQVSGDRTRDYVNQFRWLLFLFHARDCSASEDKCKTTFCVKAKKLLEHMQSCKIPDCKYPRCSQTRELLLHYKDCRNRKCPLCPCVKNFKKKEKARVLRLRGAKRSSANLNRRHRESSEPMQAYNKGGAEAPSIDDDLQPSVKRLKIEQLSQNASPETENHSVPDCKSHPLAKQEKNSDDCKSVRVEVMPMDIDISDASGIPVTRELEKHVSKDIPKGRDGAESAMDDKTICLPKEENVKPCEDVVDASKMEISSLVELFTPEQVKEHIRSLRQWVGQSKTKAEKNIAKGCSMSENACQLCAVERLVFEPIPIYCSPCGVRVKRNALHYSVAAGESRHYVCATCYNVARENSVSVDGTSIPKAKLEKKKNDEQVGEAWVQCDKCQAWQHQICALFNSRRNHGEATKYTCPNCYIQEVEQGERRPLPQSAIPGAKSLPVTTLSNHIEQRLFKNLKKERQERARLQGKSYEEVPGAESLTVRVVASVDKVLEVKKHFLELFREENYPSEFPYKSKVILLFQKIESVEVCLFGMFVQEFGTESGPPNQRRVYLSYLDSVKYFRPEVRTVSGEALRTFVYHEILIGYLDYCKKRGFTSCYIWACPPLKGEDYILYCHPEIQKMPKTDKLREWYLSMLRKASEEDVVVECTNLYDQFFVQSGECRANVTAARLPYFDGDYWPGAAEDLIQQMSQEDDGTKSNKKGLAKKVISKRALRAVGQVNASKDLLTMQKLGEIICPMKEDFIMVHLQHCCKHCCTLMVSGNRWVCNHCKNFQICDKCNEVEQKRAEKERHPISQKEKHTLFPVAIKDVPIEIEDKNDNIESESFDNRQAFLSLCQGNNYQYDTLRRAKHSSMMILYHLHNPTAPAFATICTICQQEVENAQGWHCQVCAGYDVCNACYPKASIDHSHKLISRSSATEATAQQNGQANQNYQINLKTIKELLIHVAACRTAQCQYQKCNMMKMLVRHCIACKIGPGGCTNCKRFWGLIKLHARCCRDSQCTVYKCRDFRAISSRQQQQSDKRRRAAVMEMMRKRAVEATNTC
ncbi:histone acetyltransferase HAC4 [Eutrema salsugineum]|uniref:histone acetyltransferase HAC4 n=1 Tax=Eutrema salsugineum TaxID=72664 RepID=UPI000CED54BF|nr:histone acetyltransferase HAC4 [Eutrema salsugineum]